MAKTLIDVDEEQLAAAQKVLKTETKKDTVKQPCARSRRWRHAAVTCNGSSPAGFLTWQTTK